MKEIGIKKFTVGVVDVWPTQHYEFLTSAGRLSRIFCDFLKDSVVIVSKKN